MVAVSFSSVLIVTVLSGKTLNEISKILSGEIDDIVNIYFSKNHILFEFDQTIVVSRLIDGEYFRIDQMLSSDYETKIKINKKEFLDCIDRATLLVREGEKKPIIIEITDNSMELRIDSAMGSMNENIDIYRQNQICVIFLVIPDKTWCFWIYEVNTDCFIIDYFECIDQKSWIKANKDIFALFININIFIHGTHCRINT